MTQPVTDFVKDYRTTKDRVRRLELREFPVATGGGDTPPLTWTFVPTGNLSAGVDNGYVPDPTDTFNIAYAYDANFLYLRGAVKPNVTTVAWSNFGILFTIPVPVSPSPAITNGNTRFAPWGISSTAHGKGLALGEAKLSASVIQIRGDVPTPWSADVSGGIFLFCDSQFPLR